MEERWAGPFVAGKGLFEFVGVAEVPLKGLEGEGEELLHAAQVGAEAAGHGLGGVGVQGGGAELPVGLRGEGGGVDDAAAQLAEGLPVVVLQELVGRGLDEARGDVVVELVDERA